MEGFFGFLGVHIATNFGREKREDLVRRCTERQHWHDTNQSRSRAQALDVLLMRS